MSERLAISFAAIDADREPVLVVIAAEDLVMSPATQTSIERAMAQVRRAAEAAQFKGKAKSTLEILAPQGLSVQRLVVLGAGPAGEGRHQDLVGLGGQAVAQIVARKAGRASLVADLPDMGGRRAVEAAADMALGAVLRHYEFRKYRSRAKRENGEAHDGLEHLVIHVDNPDAVRSAFKRREAVAEGVLLARDLVNEPANVLGPVEFAERIEALTAAGLEISVLDEAQIREKKMGALLAVAQGSERPPRVAIMQWHGAKSKRAKPLCFIGKGVVFDTGGISMKPAAGMEDMKGDMAGAAAVTGLMLTLAKRQAPINAVGLVGLVENMPSGGATRPGDIVTAMSGQTIEVLNTDAEGRLVLADVVTYAQETFQPKLIVDLATLTGAIIVALGKEHAGLFCNNDRLAADLAEAGEATGEKIWRMPLGSAYDKLIDSKTADMKNIGGRWGGAITGAQFIGRFVKDDMPWAHLDVAGVAMDSSRTDISTGWASGWGVRLLDRFVADSHEKS